MGNCTCIQKTNTPRIRAAMNTSMTMTAFQLAFSMTFSHRNRYSRQLRIRPMT